MDNQIVIFSLLAIIGICFFWFMLLLIGSINTRRLRKHYNAYQDLSKQGELQRSKGRGDFGRVRAVSDSGLYSRERELTERDLTAQGLIESQGRQLLPTTTSSTTREDSISRREPSYKPRNIFESIRDRRNT